MRCFSCHRLSRSIICDACAASHFRSDHRTRHIGTLDIHSFFRYSSIETLLLTKHTPVGWRLYRWMGEHFLRPFIDTFAREQSSDIAIIGVDERPKGGYAHIATLTHPLRRIPRIEVQHATLIAGEDVSYAGQPLQYRVDHPREFRYTGPSNIEAILIDDIVTTGITLHEAWQVLQDAGVDVLFAVTLADAREE
jgi:competence protein ComFC